MVQEAVKMGPSGAAEASQIPSLSELRSMNACSVTQAAAILGIGRSTAFAAAKDGSLPVLRVRNRLLVPTRKLLAMLGADAEEE